MRLLPLLLLAASPLAATSLEEASRLVEAGAAKEALPQLHALAAASAGDAAVRYWYARALLDTGDLAGAEKEFIEATKLDPKHADAFAWLGNTYGSEASNAGMLKAMGLASKMRAAWDKAIELQPDNLAARTGYLQFYLAAPGIAGGSIAKAREQLPYVAKGDAYLGKLLEAQINRQDEKLAEAEMQFRELAREKPDRREAWLGLGELLVEAKRHDEAFKLFEDWAAVPGASAWASYFSGRLSALTGERLEAGEKHLRAYIAAPLMQAGSPPLAAAHARLGQVLAHLKRPDEARSAFEEALRLDPENRTAKAGLKALGKRN